MNIVDQVNLRTMRSAAAVKIYSRHYGRLELRESAMLERVAQEARGKSILDIGVGGGRTVPALLALSPDYLGVDNSPEMIDACKCLFPEARFELADARKLTSLADSSIFLAVFSCNGISMVQHDDRVLILREVFRVLQPGGLFVFSTYNQSSPEHTEGFQFPEYEFSINPARLLVRSARFVKATLTRLVNRSRFRKHDVRTPEYSMINDKCHDYGTMLYYISLSNQRRQLETIGFAKDAEAYDFDGSLIQSDTSHDSLALIARKPADST